MGVSTPRMLPMQHMARTIKEVRDGVSPDPPQLGPDEMQLYSYYRPGLVAGQYEVSVVQDISATVPSDRVKQQKLQVTNVRKNSSNTIVNEPQRFEVVVPRFTLDPKLINSYYPPDGHQDEGRILPHVVLNDPHYPWEIDAGSTPKMSGPIDGGRNLVPWVGLVVFDPDELRIPTVEQIKSLNIPGIQDVNQQNATGTFPMQVKDYFASVPKASRVDFEKGYGLDISLLTEVQSSSDRTQVIFPTKQLFKDIFNDCESMKYLAHVRNINTVGFPDAGIEQLGLYSVVISSRTGQFDIDQARTQVCHLVSIENFDSTLPGIDSWLADPNATGSDRIGIFSLYSWIYTALPPDPVNFVDTVENLVRHQQMFRPNQTIIDAMEADLQKSTVTPARLKASQLLLERLKAGYTFARWRTETGEETSALNRGPLVPLRQPSSPALDLPDCSNTSKEYQILGKDTGLMDLSYSSAWQLGKTLAIADPVFSAAMLRFRSSLYNLTASETRATVNRMTPKAQLLQNLSISMRDAGGLADRPPGAPRRIHCERPSRPLCNVNNPRAQPFFRRSLRSNFQVQTSAGSDQFNEFNAEPANDNDWAIIHSWLADKLFLSDIPPHYLIPEASFVPVESLRFFFIDNMWLDCLLDGALSVANHLDHDNDLLRTDVKRRFNNYLRQEVSGTGVKPQIPCFGFILRSRIIKTMPDLRIAVKWTVADPDGHIRHPVCRYTKFDDTTLICLLDRQPEELDSITLAQPPHQQRFSLGSGLTGALNSEDHVERLRFVLRNLYTGIPPEGEWPMSAAQPTADQTRTWFNWRTRCIQLRPMMSDMNGILQRAASASSSDGEYNDDVPNSCALGIELNDPSYYFVIRPPNTTDTTLPPQTPFPRDRQLYIKQAVDEPQVQLLKSPMELMTRTVLSAKPSPSSTPGKLSVAQATISSLPLVPDPPHIQTKVQPWPSSLLALRTPSRILGIPTNLFSQFALTIYADYKPFPKPRDLLGFDPVGYLPTQNLYFYDLIFSLRKIVSRSAYQLLEIQIDLPNEGLDPGGKDPRKEPLIKQNYAGPGAEMLSNQRFVPLLYTDTDHLRIRLVPRTSGDNYRFDLSDDKSRELSFRLAEADIAKVRAGQYVPVRGSPLQPQWRGVAACTMVEIYAVGQNGTWPVTSTVEVVKWGTRDAEDKALEAAEQQEIGRG